MKKILFVYPANRKQLWDQVRNCTSPDNALYGLNHMQKYGFEAQFKDAPLLLERLLDILFLPFIKIFFSQIDIDFKLGRALLLLPSLNRADCIVANTDGIALAICFLKRLRLVRKPVVYAIGLFYVQGRLARSINQNKKSVFRNLYKWLLQTADQVLYHAPIEKQKLIKLGIYNPATCAFLPMGSDATFFNLVKFNKIKIHQNTVVSVGKDRARDYRTLLEVAKELPSVQFIIVARKNNLLGLAVPRNVKTCLNIPYNQTAVLYKKASVVVIPIKEMHRSSGQMTLTDCLQCAKPIIISDVAGIKHYPLVNNFNAIKTHPQDSKELKRVLELLLGDARLRNKLSKNAKAIAKTFSTKNYSTELSKIISSAIDEFRLKPVDEDDLEFMRLLRNENKDFFAGNNKSINKKDQQKWFSNYLKDRNDHTFILVKNGQKIGVGAIYNTNSNKRTAEIGRFVIDKAYRSKGYGKVLINKIEDIAFKRLELRELKLKVLANNQAALSLYKDSGFKKQHEIITNGKRLILMIKKKNILYNSGYSEQK